MLIKELLLEGSPLDAALRRGWVRMRYTRKDGQARVLMVTTNPRLYKYTFRRSKRTPPRPGMIRVWERMNGWRALYRRRVGGWESA